MIRGERWQQVKELLDETLDMSPGTRRAFLDASCGGDDHLRRQVESLVEEEERAGDFLQDPIFVLSDGGEGGAGDTEPETQPDEAGHADVERRIGPYRLIRQLGRGGMGTVHLAQRDDDEYQSRVAIKVLRPGGQRQGNAQLLSRFLVERQILADLNHPNIAELYDGGTLDGDAGDADAGLPYFVMELVDGATITEYCDRERLDVDARLELFDQVCAAVQAAHRNLIVHRDIKPANILVTGDGVTPEGDKRAILKLLDFGIAKPLDPAAFPQAVETTGSWRRPMTPIYASPEQIRGEPVTTATDVYSLGVVLFELLTGRHPYRAGTSQGDTPRGTQPFQSVEDAVLRQPVPRPSDTVEVEHEVDEDQTPGVASTVEISRRRRATPRQFRRQLAGDLDNIVLMALRKDPDRRYATVEQLAEDLRRHRRGLPVVARQDTAGYRIRKFVRRNRLAVASTAVVAALVVTLAVVMTILAARLKASDQKARGLAEQAASLAENLNIALEQKQQEEVQRKLAEAAQLSLQGQSEEAERLRRDVEAAEAELAARTLALERLRGQLGSTATGGDAPSPPAASPSTSTEDLPEATEQQVAEARGHAEAAAAERDAALARAAAHEQRLEVLDRQLAEARAEQRDLEAALASRGPAASGPAAGGPTETAELGETPEQTCQSGEKLEDQGFDFVRVCAGTFTIGSPPSDRLAYENELPTHDVTLSEFWIGKYEVTNDQYRRRRPDHEGDARLPASAIGWTQARRFCKHFGFDLPTEAEWEYATRAGSTTRWFFGDSEDDLDAYAWYAENSGETPHPVGQKRPNAWGLHDTYGNVWEWVADMFSPYSPEAKVDPTGPPVTPGSRRMVRGGAYDDPPRLLRSAFRGGTRPVFRRRDIGFRCVRRVPKP